VAEVALWTLAAAGGASVGLLYFGGLWWTIRRLPDAGHPAALVLGSFAVRTALAGLAFFVLFAGDPSRLVAALGGFVLVRVGLVRRVRPAPVESGGERR
jgi:F1F0 ATPase subunit 2